MTSVMSSPLNQKANKGTKLFIFEVAYFIFAFSVIVVSDMYIIVHADNETIRLI